MISNPTDFLPKPLKEPLIEPHKEPLIEPRRGPPKKPQQWPLSQCLKEKMQIGEMDILKGIKIWLVLFI